MQIWDMTASEVRTRIREGEHLGPTSGVARGHVQANLVILPSEYAFDFLKFCVRNLKPCPVLEVTDVGSPEPSVVAPGADLRVDLPGTASTKMVSSSMSPRTYGRTGGMTWCRSCWGAVLPLKPRYLLQACIWRTSTRAGTSLCTQPTVIVSHRGPSPDRWS